MVSALFWPPLEVLPSLALSWTSVTPRLLDGPDKVNLELIPLLFPFKMHIKLTELHKSCIHKSHDDNICDVVASHSTPMLHSSGSLNRKTLLPNIVYFPDYKLSFFFSCVACYATYISMRLICQKVYCIASMAARCLPS